MRIMLATRWRPCLPSGAGDQRCRTQMMRRCRRKGVHALSAAPGCALEAFRSCVHHMLLHTCSASQMASTDASDEQLHRAQDDHCRARPPVLCSCGMEEDQVAETELGGTSQAACPLCHRWAPGKQQRENMPCTTSRLRDGLASRRSGDAHEGGEPPREEGSLEAGGLTEQ